ncbi:hypothetical protein ISN44_As06g014940 [Arabidopsis suecica]|uniref:F-box associated domain-containing protein n=1 Tax=Arabidopsis suecica TaxID=45249 RepID=A0A8T2CCW2_ARASU|nr:hypothetical protein ISN44_As06g014940 [Arabidopsis suecica]
MIRGQLLEDPDILLRRRWDPRNLSNNVSLMTLTFHSSTTPVSFKTQTIPGKPNFFKVTQSCDCLVCIYDLESLMCVMNPATRWQRSLPQPEVLQQYQSFDSLIHEFPSFGFGKDNIKDIYKMTDYFWLIYGNQERDTVVEILCFDLHTEIFSVMSYCPVGKTLHPLVEMSSLDNLPVRTDVDRARYMVGNKPYMEKKTYRIDNPIGPGCVQIWSMAPVSVLVKKKKKKRLLRLLV